MDSNYMHFKQGRGAGRSRTGHLIGLVGLVILVSFAAGCAVAKPPASKAITEQKPC